MDQASETPKHQLAKLEQQVQDTNDPDELIAWISVNSLHYTFRLFLI